MKKHLIILFLIIVSAGTVMAQGFSPVPSMPRFPSFPGISAPSSDFGGEKIGEEKEAKKKSIIEFDVSGYMGGLNIGGWTGFGCGMDMRFNLLGVELSFLFGIDPEKIDAGYVGGGLGYRFINNDRVTVSAAIFCGYGFYEMNEEYNVNQGSYKDYRQGTHDGTLLAGNLHTMLKLLPHVSLSANLLIGETLEKGYFTVIPQFGCTLYI